MEYNPKKIQNVSTQLNYYSTYIGYLYLTKQKRSTNDLLLIAFKFGLPEELQKLIKVLTNYKEAVTALIKYFGENITK